MSDLPRPLTPEITDLPGAGQPTGEPDAWGALGADLPTLPGPLTPSGHLRRRQLVSRLFEAGQTTAALLAVAVLGIVVYSVASRGASVLSIDFLTKSPPLLPNGASGGGIAPAIVGTAVLIAMATAIAMPIGILVALYLTEFAGRRSRTPIRLALDLMNGLPTIVVGLFVFGLLVVGHHQSGFAGSFALAIIMLPLIARATQEVLLLVPASLREAADALGVSHWRTVLGVVLPSARRHLDRDGAGRGARGGRDRAADLVHDLGLRHRGIRQPVRQSGLPNIPIYIFTASEAADPYGFARLGRGLRPLGVHPPGEPRRQGARLAEAGDDGPMRPPERATATTPGRRAVRRRVRIHTAPLVAGGEPAQETAGRRPFAFALGDSAGAQRSARTVGREAIFDVSNVSVSYGSSKAIAGVTLQIHRNLITAIIGPSGCGKTTFLRSLNRMNDTVPGFRIDGKILYHGHDIYGSGVDRVEVRRRIGMVFQRPNPFPKSIYDNVAWAPRNLRMKAGLDERVERALRARRSGTRSRTGSRTTPSACPAGSSSGCASRARSRSSPTCCCWTSRHRRSTRSPRRRSRS